MMKNKSNKPHPLELGAGIGLMVLMIVFMLLDSDNLPIYLFWNSFGLMLSTGLFSGRGSRQKNCGKKTQSEQAI